MAADFIAFDLGNSNFAGALDDPVAALVFCTPAQVSLSVINGRTVARDGHLLTLEHHNRLAATLLNN